MPAPVPTRPLPYRQPRLDRAGRRLAAPLIEAALRVASGRPGATGQLAATLAALDPAPAAVARLQQVLDREGVLPLVAQALAPWNDRHAVARRLSAAAAAAAAHDLPLALAQVAVLAQACAALAAAGITCVAVKGPVVGTLAYGGWERRPPGEDVDLLIAPEDLDGALACLAGLGFTPRKRLPQRARAFAMHCFGECTLGRGDQLIDLHWTLGFPYLPSTPVTAALLRERRTVVLAGAPAPLPTLSELETLLTIAQHGLKEEWRQWRWAADLALLVARTPAPVRAEVALRARARGAERQWACAEAMALVLLGTDPDERTDPGALVLAHACARALRGRGPLVPWLWLRLATGTRERWGALTSRLRPWPSDWQTYDLPARWAGLYWLLRPFGVLRRRWQRWTAPRDPSP